MNTLPTLLETDSAPSAADDALFRVELEIARRADELTRRFGTNPVSALEHWRAAEREVWQDGDVGLRRSPPRRAVHAVR